MEQRERIGLAALGTIGLVLALGGFALHRPAERSGVVEADMTGPAAAPAGPAPEPAGTPSPNSASPGSPASDAHADCLRKGIEVTLGAVRLRVSGPPALTLVTGTGAGEEINFATKAGLEKGCAQPEVAAKAVALNLDAMDKAFGAAANWRAAFCQPPADEATRFLCAGEERPAGTPRFLAVAAVYEPASFDGESLFRDRAPDLNNFRAWQERLTKAGTPPPAQADGGYDVYPGGVWLERDPKAGPPFLVSCDVDGLPVTGPHYCIGALDLDGGLRARLEFRTVTAEIGKEAAAAATNLRTLLAAWRAGAAQSSSGPAQPGK